MLNSKWICAIEDKSKNASFDHEICQALECHANATECIQMKVGSDRVIEIWACQVCSKKLR